MKKYIDLHVHTNYSDGVNTPKEVLEMAINNNTKYLSITDHNSIKGNIEARNIIKKENIDIEFIKGIEIDSNYKDKLYDTFHVLGYHCDDEKIQNYLDELERRNNKFFFETFDYLKNNFNNEMSLEEFDTMFDSISSRPEQRIMDYLMKKNFVSNRKDIYIEHNITNNFDDLKTVIEVIYKSGGIPILAHPSRYETRYKISKEELSELVLSLREYGLMGIEAYYSTNTIEQTKYWLNFANENNMLYTAGTDFHQIAEETRKVKLEISKGDQGNMFITDENIIKKLVRD